MVEAEPAASGHAAAGHPRIVITHDFTETFGGAERVTQEFAAMYPDAPVVAFIGRDEVAQRMGIAGRFRSVLPQRGPLLRHYRLLTPVYPAIARRVALPPADVVISSSYAFAHRMRAPGARHLCYCFTPLRWAWEPRFLEGERLGVVGRAAMPALIAALRRGDRRSAERVDTLVTTSRTIARRIADAYGREAEIVPPPVDVDRYLAQPRGPQEDGYYVVLGRLVPYKRTDLAVQACVRMGRRLVVAGEGRDLVRLRRLAGGRPQIEFRGRVPDADLPGLLAGARALLFPGEEDFGIVPVESMAAGTPVIAYGVGGINDTVLDGRTGVLYRPQGVDGLCAAIERFESLSFDEVALRAQARCFAPRHFRDAISALVASLA